MVKAKRVYRQHPPEFRQEAVALITEHGYSVAQAAASLGIRANLLYRWKQQVDDEQAGTRLTGDERAELLRLRKEIKQLKLEKDILKKASAFFAKEMK